ncbi:Lipoate-protein ligase A [Mycoplasmopsis caviae]|uniref:lipoate--protein ligase n=1 Tax=Mycoplasmopsis caviae TaxID=55603 RepID=A0A3P8LIR1_9BACT|nr:lipoate protein ligase C-terminal domain-containing protein [Mycoplasmopsis caviae]VDR42502.1 Lipoate-protein ligase A [Mycoplasmopsis caviae]
MVNGCKISGNAQYISQNRIVSHGTLLFNVDLSKLSKALNPAKVKYESKGIQSIRSRVTNIYDELVNKISAEDFITRLINYFVKNFSGEYLEVDYAKYQEQLDILSSKFSNEDWIYNKAANFKYQNGAKFPGGILVVKGDIEQGIIKNLVFEGDFLSKKNVHEIEHMFDNVKLNEENLLKVLGNIENLDEYFGTVTKEEIISLLIG